jgi:hypothetical protein
MKTYKQITDPVSNKFVIFSIDEKGKEFWIPVDVGNSDYQAYLAEQSTPMVTDEADSL